MNPALILKFIGGSIGLTGGITGSIFSSFQAFTKITIEEFFGTEWFDYKDGNEDWKFLKKKLDESKNTDEKKLKLTGLEGIKKNTGDANGAKVKEWCSTKKSFKIKKLLPSSFDSLLLDYIKSFCLITVGEKLTPEKQFTSWGADESKLKTNAKSLGSHVEGTNGNINGIKELEEIKSKNDEDNKGKDLLVWCQKTYKKSYKGENDNLWKLANHYCKKTTIPGG